MARLTRIIIIHTTANVDDADTDANFQLIASSPGTDFVQQFPGLAHDERERGRTDEYTFVIPDDLNIEDSTELTMQMIDTTDAWLPQSIWAIGETVSGMVILGAHPEWPADVWFDRGANPAGPASHRIDT